MDVEQIVAELRAERDRLEGVISALERLHGKDESGHAPKRRGRKFMDKQGRQEVSTRMKRYWAKRRLSANAAAEIAESASASGDQGGSSDQSDPPERVQGFAA